MPKDNPDFALAPPSRSFSSGGKQSSSLSNKLDNNMLAIDKNSRAM